jgi:hypothetical protein
MNDRLADSSDSRSLRRLRTNEPEDRQTAPVAEARMPCAVQRETSARSGAPSLGRTIIRRPFSSVAVTSGRSMWPAPEARIFRPSSQERPCRWSSVFQTANPSVVPVANHEFKGVDVALKKPTQRQAARTNRTQDLAEDKPVSPAPRTSRATPRLEARIRAKSRHPRPEKRHPHHIHRRVRTPFPRRLELTAARGDCE